MPTPQKPCATPQERKAGIDDPGQIFEAGGTHNKVVYSGTWTYICPDSNINEIKLNQNTDHISAFTRPIISSCLHTTYVNPMISVVSTQICHPSNLPL
jgi:hypothetical protein